MELLRSIRELDRSSLSGCCEVRFLLLSVVYRLQIGTDGGNDESPLYAAAFTVTELAVFLLSGAPLRIALLRLFGLSVAGFLLAESFASRPSIPFLSGVDTGQSVSCAIQVVYERRNASYVHLAFLTGRAERGRHDCESRSSLSHEGDSLLQGDCVHSPNPVEADPEGSRAARPQYKPPHCEEIPGFFGHDRIRVSFVRRVLAVLFLRSTRTVSSPSSV